MTMNRYVLYTITRWLVAYIDISVIGLIILAFFIVSFIVFASVVMRL